MKPKLIIHLNNPKAPKPNQPLAPGVCAVIVGKNNEIFLHQRIDSNKWSLPGGQMKIGESISQSILREIKEETNLDVKIQRVMGIYTSPKCVFEFPDGKVYQSFVVAFLAKAVSYKVILNKESISYQWFKKEEIKKLDTLPFVKEIIINALSEKNTFFD